MEFTDMTQEEVIRMAREADPKANLSEPYCLDHETMAWLERFAALVAAAEREACADLCYQLVDNSRETRFATAIRARGQA
jgi:hypothetical protein